MENLEKKLGNKCKAVRIGKINKETEYVLNYLGIDIPYVENINNDQKVILVDHNESTQSVENIEMKIACRCLMNVANNGKQI